MIVLSILGIVLLLAVVAIAIWLWCFGDIVDHATGIGSGVLGGKTGTRRARTQKEGSMTNTNTTREFAPKRFRTILADPPWEIGQQEGRYGASKHYDLMTLDRIKGLPVADLAEENAHLYLWTINGAIREGIDVMEAWGFTYRAPLTWIKPRYGLGQYLRNQTEHLLLGTRGRAPVKFRGQGTWMYAPLQDHSHKPEEQYAVIERLSDGPYLELFARRCQPGWLAWGNELIADIIIPGYPVPSDVHVQEELP